MESKSEQIIQLLIAGGFVSPSKVKEATDLIESVSTPPSVPADLNEAAATEAKRRYPEEINVEKSTPRNQRKNQRIFAEGAKWGATRTLPVHTGKEEGKLKEALINLNQSIDDYWNSYDRPDSLVKKVNNRQQEAAKVLASSSVEGEQGTVEFVEWIDNVATQVQKGMWTHSIPGMISPSTTKELWQHYKLTLKSK